MRFLLDASADFRLFAFLTDLGHDVATIAKDHPQNLSDADVLAVAVAEQRILITNDRDFGELIFRRRLPHAGVIYFRLERTDLDTKIVGLQRVLTDYADKLSGFVTVAEGGIRIRGAPGLTEGN